MLAATDAVKRAMRDGADHGYTDEWTEQSSHEHLMHAARHLAELIRGGADEDLDHGLCRLAMAKIRRREEG
jgi:hypothetical protein